MFLFGIVEKHEESNIGEGGEPNHRRQSRSEVGGES